MVFAITQKIDHNKPDLVFFHQTTRGIYIVEFAVPGKYNITVEAKHKRQIYQDPLFEIYKLSTGNSVKLVLFIVSVLGAIKQFYLSTLAKILTCSLQIEFMASWMQRAVVLGFLRLIRIPYS